MKVHTLGDMIREKIAQRKIELQKEVKSIIAEEKLVEKIAEGITFNGKKIN